MSRDSDVTTGEHIDQAAFSDALSQRYLAYALSTIVKVTA